MGKGPRGRLRYLALPYCTTYPNPANSGSQACGVPGQPVRKGGRSLAPGGLACDRLEKQPFCDLQAP